jgi:hypothetical protein
LELAKLKKTEVTIVEACKAAMSGCRSSELKVIIAVADRAGCGAAQNGRGAG